ncbi:hypothetical protein H4R33_006942 [Dimargaris cristalligena]|nr:hypothetical protein H4R33_006942 [Dimargaris cristalligena]
MRFFTSSFAVLALASILLLSTTVSATAPSSDQALQGHANRSQNLVKRSWLNPTEEEKAAKLQKENEKKAAKLQKENEKKAAKLAKEETKKKAADNKLTEKVGKQFATPNKYRVAKYRYTNQLAGTAYKDRTWYEKMFSYDDKKYNEIKKQYPTIGNQEYTVNGKTPKPSRFYKFLEEHSKNSAVRQTAQAAPTNVQ